MPIEKVHEAVRVHADFAQSGAIRPVRFWHGERNLPVRRVRGSWTERDGTSRRMYFNVSVGTPDIYQLLLETEGMLWYLEAVIVEG